MARNPLMAFLKLGGLYISKVTAQSNWKKLIIELPYALGNLGHKPMPDVDQKETTWKRSVAIVLSEHGGALHYTDIADKIASKNIRLKLGATPSQTVNSIINMSLRRGDGLFYRADEGTYGLVAQRDASQFDGKPEEIDINSLNIQDDPLEEDATNAAPQPLELPSGAVRTE
jgi:hypothetical protein